MTNKSVRPPAAATSWNTIAPPCAGPTGGPTGPGVGSCHGDVAAGVPVGVAVPSDTSGTTTTRPVIAPWYTQWYRNTPGDRNRTRKPRPGANVQLNHPASLVTECSRSPRFTHRTVDPTVTVTAAGTNTSSVTSTSTIGFGIGVTCSPCIPIGAADTPATDPRTPMMTAPTPTDPMTPMMPAPTPIITPPA